MSTPPPFVHANASWVTDYLAIGGDLDYDDDLAIKQAQELETAGITHILDLRREWSDEDLVEIYAPSITYHHFGVEDQGQDIPADWFRHVVGWCNDALENPEARVLVHCHMGVNRAPSAGFAVLLAQGFDVIEALTAIRAARPEAAILYSRSALQWFMYDAETTIEERANAFLLLAQWHKDHPHNTVEVIERIRRQETRKIADLAQRNAPVRLLSGNNIADFYYVREDAQIFLLNLAYGDHDTDWLARAVKITGKNKRIERAWSVQGDYDFKEGDRVFLLKYGLEPRGIIASGFINNDGCEPDPSFHNRPRKRGEQPRFLVNVSWDVVLNDDEVLPLPQIRRRFPKINWNPARNSVIDNKWLFAMERAWMSHVQRVYAGDLVKSPFAALKVSMR